MGWGWLGSSVRGLSGGCKTRTIWKGFIIFGRETGKFKAGKDKVKGFFCQSLRQFFVYLDTLEGILARREDVWESDSAGKRPYSNNPSFLISFALSSFAFILVMILSPPLSWPSTYHRQGYMTFVSILTMQHCVIIPFPFCQWSYKMRSTHLPRTKDLKYTTLIIRIRKKDAVYHKCRDEGIQTEFSRPVT